MYMYELDEEKRNAVDDVMDDIIWTVDVRYEGENTVEGVKNFICSIYDTLDLNDKFQRDLHDKIEKLLEDL